MAITKIGQNLWKIRVSVRVQGKDYPVNRQETFAGTKTEADQRKADIIKEIRNEISGSLKSMASIKTFSELIDLFKEKKGTLSASHLTKAEFLKTEFGHVLLNQFPDRFENYLKILKDTPSKAGKTRSGASINRYVEIARSAYNVALKLELVSINPINIIRFPKLEEKPRDRYLTEKEEERLIAEITTHRPHILPFVKYNLLVPCRKGELIRAKKEQYNPFTNTIYIPDSKAGIALHKPVPESMKEYFRKIPEECQYLFYRKIKDDGTGEKYLPIGDFKKAFSYCLKKADIQDFRIHDLRHRAVTSLIENGNHENMVADVAGWKSTKMLKNYRHINTLKSAQSIKFGTDQKTIEKKSQVKRKVYK